MSILIHGRRLLLPLATTALLSFTFSPASAWYDKYGHWHHSSEPQYGHMYVHPEATHVHDPYVHPVHGPRHCAVDPRDPYGHVHCHPHT
jgi:hypothetical protein